MEKKTLHPVPGFNTNRETLLGLNFELENSLKGSINKKPNGRKSFLPYTSGMLPTKFHRKQSINKENL